jgi:hypothetical protein
MSEEIEKKQMFKIINFNQAIEPPRYVYNEKRNIIEWGRENLYPQELLEMYNYKGSSIHKAIVNKKQKMVSGNGFNPITDPKLLEFIKKHKLEREVKKASLDYELYNGFSFEIVWNNEQTDYASFKHIPFQKIRVGIEDKDLPFKHYWISTDWAQYKSKREEYHPEFIRAYNPLVKTGRQLYYYCEYNPEVEFYPIAGYSTTLNWISADFEVSRFHLNQLRQGFSPSFILNFATGIPSDEEMNDYYRDFRRNYEGTENSGKIIITYSEGQDGKPELIPINLNDSDDRFLMLKDQISENIVLGHEIPVQLLLLVPGKLGSTDERIELLKDFQFTYVSPRQENIEECLNELLENIGFTEQITLREYSEPTLNNKQII